MKNPSEVVARINFSYGITRRQLTDSLSRLARVNNREVRISGRRTEEFYKGEHRKEDSWVESVEIRGVNSMRSLELKAESYTELPLNPSIEGDLERYSGLLYLNKSPLALINGQREELELIASTFNKVVSGNVASVAYTEKVQTK
ncbi:MAG: hypothetical protein AABW73_00635 [Nanoarchaeota archaeon]